MDKSLPSSSIRKFCEARLFQSVKETDDESLSHLVEIWTLKEEVFKLANEFCTKYSDVDALCKAWEKKRLPWEITRGINHASDMLKYVEMSKESPGLEKMAASIVNDLKYYELTVDSLKAAIDREKKYKSERESWMKEQEGVVMDKSPSNSSIREYCETYLLQAIKETDDESLTLLAEIWALRKEFFELANEFCAKYPDERALKKVSEDNKLPRELIPDMNHASELWSFAEMWRESPGLVKMAGRIDRDLKYSEYTVSCLKPTIDREKKYKSKRESWMKEQEGAVNAEKLGEVKEGEAHPFVAMDPSNSSIREFCEAYLLQAVKETNDESLTRLAELWALRKEVFELASEFCAKYPDVNALYTAWENMELPRELIPDNNHAGELWSFAELSRESVGLVKMAGRIESDLLRYELSVPDLKAAIDREKKHKSERENWMKEQDVVVDDETLGEIKEGETLLTVSMDEGGFADL